MRARRKIVGRENKPKTINNKKLYKHQKQRNNIKRGHALKNAILKSKHVKTNTKNKKDIKRRKQNRQPKK